MVSGAALRKRHSLAPAGEKYQPAPVARNRSSSPSPSKSPTPREEGPKRMVGSDAPNWLLKILTGKAVKPQSIFVMPGGQPWTCMASPLPLALSCLLSETLP